MWEIRACVSCTQLPGRPFCRVFCRVPYCACVSCTRLPGRPFFRVLRMRQLYTATRSAILLYSSSLSCHKVSDIVCICACASCTQLPVPGLPFCYIARTYVATRSVNQSYTVYCRFAHASTATNSVFCIAHAPTTCTQLPGLLFYFYVRQ
jgi:hypothetical protein